MMPVSVGCFGQTLLSQRKGFFPSNVLLYDVALFLSNSFITKKGTIPSWLAWQILKKICNFSNTYYLKLNVLENTDESNICSLSYLSGFWQNALFMLSFLGNGHSV